MSLPGLVAVLMRVTGLIFTSEILLIVLLKLCAVDVFYSCPVNSDASIRIINFNIFESSSKQII